MDLVNQGTCNVSFFTQRIAEVRFKAMRICLPVWGCSNSGARKMYPTCITEVVRRDLDGGRGTRQSWHSYQHHCTHKRLWVLLRSHVLCTLQTQRFQQLYFGLSVVSLLPSLMGMVGSQGTAWGIRGRVEHIWALQTALWALLVQDRQCIRATPYSQEDRDHKKRTLLQGVNKTSTKEKVHFQE